MPKILINEKDKTSPGTPTNYANYSVLIAGFSGKTPDVNLADSNGVYEFSSAQEFKDVIGLKAPMLFALICGKYEKNCFESGKINKKVVFIYRRDFYGHYI